MRSLIPTAAPLAALGVLAALSTGCGPDCQSTCNRLYLEGECNIESPGIQRSELLDLCLDECNGALEKPGEIRKDYKPSEYTPSNDGTVTFTNDAEAALWMECVAETSCEHLNAGYCAPVW